MESTDDWLDDCFETVGAGLHSTSGVRRSAGGKGDDMKDRAASKPHSTPLTLKWLEENYEIAEGVCIPRSTLYLHYLDFCEKNDSQPVNAASFGKIIRQQFPQITTRRLGTRGQSKYHYYGIGVKESSLYYDIMYSKKGMQSTGDGRKDSVKQLMTYSPRSKLGTLLPEFPVVSDLKLPEEIAEDKVNTFIMMYRTHCQRILDTVIRANFDEVQNFLLHFWQGMPQHIVPILGNHVIVSLVGVCDAILYKAIAGVLMPTVLQPLPDSLTQVIRRFARQLDEWLHLALEDLAEPLRRMKFDLARRFAQVLRRQTSLNHLCQAARTVIHSPEITGQMLEDWSHVDLTSICKQTLYTMDNFTERDQDTIISLYSEFEQLLGDQAPIESYTEWLDSMVDRCVISPSNKKPGSMKRLSRQFLLMWSCFGTRVIRDMTLHSAPSFGSFHLLHLMFDDYVMYLVESLQSQERAGDLLRTVRGQEIPASGEDPILPNPATPFPTLAGPSSPASSDNSSCMERQSVITGVRDMYHTGNYENASDSSDTGRLSRDCIMSQSHDFSMPQPRSQDDLSPVNQSQHTVISSDCQYSRYIQDSIPGNTMSAVPRAPPSGQIINYGVQSQGLASQYYYGAAFDASGLPHNCTVPGSGDSTGYITSQPASDMSGPYPPTASYGDNTYPCDEQPSNPYPMPGFHVTGYDFNSARPQSVNRKRRGNMGQLEHAQKRNVQDEFAYQLSGSYARA